MQPNKKKKNNLIHIKFFTAAISLASLVVFWNQFAREEWLKRLEENQAPTPTDEKPTTVLELPPLPTLVPVVAASEQPVASSGNSNSVVSPLRSVSQPTPMPTADNSKPVFENVIISGPSNNGGGDGGGGPVTSTGSSR